MNSTAATPALTPAIRARPSANPSASTTNKRSSGCAAMSATNADMWGAAYCMVGDPVVPDQPFAAPPRLGSMNMMPISSSHASRLFLATLFALSLARVASAEPKVPRASRRETPTISRAAVTDTIIGLERRSWEAWRNHDGKFYEAFLADDHVQVNARGVSNKAAVV